MRQIKIMTGWEGMLQWKFLLSCDFYKIKIKWFTGRTPKNRSYIEKIPYSKGNLFKIRMYREDAYKIVLGTKEIAHCTTLKSAVDFIEINKKKSPHTNYENYVRQIR